MNKNIQYFIKRTFDIIAALGGLIVFSPIFLILALLVRINLGSPIIFTQERVGLNNKSFKMYKFRSMTNETDKLGNLLSNEKRLTKFGRMLRSTSLDELPELVNIIKGEMSLIGPRPLPIRYLPLYSTRQIKRHNVRPGLTGWAQINGRNTISWNERFELDLWYIENFTLLLDVKIFILTIFKVFKKEGINQNGNSTMEAFKGDN